MTKYFTKTGLLLIAGICFIAGTGFIITILMLMNAKEQAAKDLVLSSYKDGYTKELEGAKVIKYSDDEIYVVIDDDKIYKVDK